MGAEMDIASSPIKMEPWPCTFVPSYIEALLP